jgi:hypothetical protein
MAAGWKAVVVYGSGLPILVKGSLLGLTGALGGLVAAVLLWDAVRLLTRKGLPAPSVDPLDSLRSGLTSTDVKEREAAFAAVRALAAQAPEASRKRLKNFLYERMRSVSDPALREEIYGLIQVVKAQGQGSALPAEMTPSPAQGAASPPKGGEAGTGEGIKKEAPRKLPWFLSAFYKLNSLLVFSKTMTEEVMPGFADSVTGNAMGKTQYGLAGQSAEVSATLAGGGMMDGQFRLRWKLFN